MTHHSNGEVVVDDLVGHRIPGLLLVIGDYLDAPAIQGNHFAGGDLPQNLLEVSPLVTFGSFPR